MGQIRKALWGLPVVGLLALYIGYGMRSQGVYFDDDIWHFVIARWALKHPDALLDIWGRPGWTILFAPVAPLGLGAARILSAIIAAGIALASGFLARSYGLRWAWLAIMFTGLQAEFVRQGFSTLTELTFALFLVLTLLAYRHERWMLMALAMGWLPLTRYESVPILAFLVWELARRRRWGAVGVALVPLLLWNGYWAVALDQWHHIMFPFNRLFFKSAQTPNGYGTGPIWYYPARLPVAIGSLCLLLAIRGALKLRWDLAHTSVTITLGVLILGYSFFPEAAGIAGYMRHLAMLAPIFGVWATAGVTTLLEPFEGWRGKLVPWVTLGAGLIGGGVALLAWRNDGRIFLDGLAALGLGVGLIVWKPTVQAMRWLLPTLVLAAFATLLAQVRPWPLTTHQQAIIRATAWLDQQPKSLVIFSSPWIPYLMERDPFDATQARGLTAASIEAAPVGTLLVWDRQYAATSYSQIPREVLERDSRFEQVYTDPELGAVFQRIKP